MLEYRLGPRINKQRGGAMVRIAEDSRKCVVFLGFPKGKRKDDMTYEGTAFLLSHDRTTYLITAAHVAELFEPASLMMVGINNNQGGFTKDPIAQPQWKKHPDSQIDIAVLEYTPPEESCVTVFPFDSVNEIGEPLGTGDLAHIVGLYQEPEVNGKLIPIVHTGNIAMLDLNVYETEDRRSVRGFLVESQTLKGLSGSPVFVRDTVPLPGIVEQGEQVPTKDQRFSDRAVVHGRIFLLGVWSSAWIVGSEKLPARDANKYSYFPMGMGVASPAFAIGDIVESDHMKLQREEARREEKQKNPITLQSSSRNPVPKSQNPRHKEDFSHLLNEVVKGRKQDDQT